MEGKSICTDGGREGGREMDEVEIREMNADIYLCM